MWINNQGAGDENSKYISFPYCFLEQIIIPLHFISAGLPPAASMPGWPPAASMPGWRNR